MKKRFWALFLAIMMVVSVLPTTAFAKPSDNNNGPSYPGGYPSGGSSYASAEKVGNESVIKFRIVNGSWNTNNVELSGGAQFTTEETENDTIILTTKWYENTVKGTNQSIEGYVLNHNTVVEKMLEGIINGAGSDYINANEGYTADDVNMLDWELKSGGLMNLYPGDALSQMTAVGEDVHEYDNLAGVYDVFAPNTEYVLILTKNAYVVTYTDGWENDVLFVDQVYGKDEGDPLEYDETTPNFKGDPNDYAPSGYQFAGWMPEDGLQPYFDKTVIRDRTYVAQWEKIPDPTYGVTYEFVNEDGTNLPAEVTSKLDTSDINTYKVGVTVTNNAPATYDAVDVKENNITVGTWTFQGWDANSKEMVAGGIEFVGTWEYTAVDKSKNTVAYEFVSDPAGQTLPVGVTSQLTTSDSATYYVGQGVTNNAPTTYNAVDVKENNITVGTWTFKGWDETSKEMVAGGIEFVGTWKYEAVDKSDNDVEYRFVSDPAGQTLPVGVTSQLTTSDSATYYVGQGVTNNAPTTYNAVDVKENNITVGTWTFKGWDETSKEMVAGGIEFVGTWEYTAVDKSKNTVAYEFVSDPAGQTLPVGVTSQLTTSDSATYYVGQGVTNNAPTTYNAVDVKENNITVGTWTFKGWDETSKEMVAGGIKFTGTWTYTEAAKYTVTYLIDSVPYGDAESYYAGAAVTVKSAPDNREGYTFSGWDKQDFTMPAENVTITGSWIKLVTVTFDANGGAWGGPVNGYTMSDAPYTTAAISQTVGSQVNEIHPAPTLDDHTFTGWHFDTAATEEVNFTFAKAYSDVTLYAGWEEIKPGDVQYTVKQHFINQAGVEDLTLNYIGVFSAPAGSKIASLIDSFEKDTQTHVYKQAETKHNGQLLDREEATLAEGDVIDLYYYMDIWNDEKNTINEGDDIPDMYQAVVKFQAGDLYGTVEGTGIVQVFTLNAEKAADAISGQITPSVEDVSVVPNEGYAFDIWTMNDGETGVNPEASITVQGGSTTNFYAHFALDKIGGVNGGDGTPDKYQALVTYKVVNGTWSNGSSTDIVKVFTLQEKNDDGVWADVAAVLGAMPTGMKPAAGYMTIGTWNKTHAADERPVHASVYTWTFTTRNAPDVTIAKYANKTSATVGETITYTIIVTNTGNVTLTDLVVKDVFTQGGNGETVWTIASLAPGASQKIEFSYRTSNHDVGGLKNIAVVTGKGPDGGEVTDITQSVETDVYREHIVRPTRPALNKEDHYAYIVGYPDGLVHPERNITRAEVSTIFFRMLLDESREDFWAQENWFSDVPADQWYNNAVSTLSNAGLITGYPDGSFKPNANITRAEFATIAIRFFLEEDVEITENNLTDVKGHWAEANINLAYALNLITGYPDNTFRPDQKITRAEAMTIVNRVLERAPHKDHLLDDMIEWPDNMDTEAWYYADVQEATNSHEFYKTEIKGEDEEYEIWTELLPVRDWAALERMWSEANSSKNPGEVVDINISTPEASN